MGIVIILPSSATYFEQVWVACGISSSTLKGYLEHDYSALLANLIFITRIILRFHSTHSRDILFDVSSRTLGELVSNIDVRLAAPVMQDEYCVLWNELVQMVQDGSHYYPPTTATDILRRLRKSHIALHKSTDASPIYNSTDDNDLISPLNPSYTFCGIRNHRHTSPKTQYLTTANPTSPPSSRSLLSGTDSIPPNFVARATEVTHDASNISPLANAAPIPTVPCPPLAVQPSMENPPAIQEDHG